jgi:UDP-N-acetylmuramoyl-L-alanyl-D-glutamate--2,6-diaminopimelate ligase
MNFHDLLQGVEVLSQSGEPILFEQPITGLQHDSRRIEPRNLFVAMKGESTDGNRYIDTAIRAGAVAVVSDSAKETPRANVAWAQVAHGRRALAATSANFYGHPARKLKISGVTGTNGKTTTTFLLSQILRFLGRGEVVLVGTVEYHFAREIIPAPHTTPESLELNRIFAKATNPRLGKYAATEAVMEVSSHALHQERVYGIPFDVALFTNLTRDHLDYHHSMEEYFASKKILFSGCGTPPPRVAVINTDDAYGRELANVARGQRSEVLTYGLESAAFQAQDIHTSPQGTDFKLQTPQGAANIRSQLVGKVNVYNMLAAAAAAMARGGDLNAVAQALGRARSAPGRFERVDCGQPFSVVVDYAHTDDALRNVTAVARDFMAAQKKPGRVITLFGCGGDRDRTKRPLMGAVAGEGSDFVILTSDNPRSEDPLAIIGDALPGLQKTGTRYAVEPERRKAIGLALSEAQQGDIVIIAGKGHEKTQTTREGVFPFDDVDVARSLLQEIRPASVSRSGDKS